MCLVCFRALCPTGNCGMAIARHSQVPRAFVKIAQVALRVLRGCIEILRNCAQWPLHYRRYTLQTGIFHSFFCWHPSASSWCYLIDCRKCARISINLICETYSNNLTSRMALYLSPAHSLHVLPYRLHSFDQHLFGSVSCGPFSVWETSFLFIKIYYYDDYTIRLLVVFVCSCIQNVLLRWADIRFSFLFYLLVRSSPA